MSNEEIARKWQASPHCGGWRRGMVTTDGCVITRVTPGDEPSVELAGAPYGHGWILSERAGLPDLSHPGTRAFLLEDVRKAWGDRDWQVTRYEGVFTFGVLGDLHPNGHAWEASTEAEALLAALQAAPEAARPEVNRMAKEMRAAPEAK